MYRLFSLFLLVALLAYPSCKSPQMVIGKWQDGLEIRKVAPGLYIHTSPINLSNGQVFPCNGMIFIDQGEAVVFDTPVYEKDTEELLRWLQQEQKVKVKAIVPTHFHDDCLGGLPMFHEAGIRSYANRATFELAKEQAATLPQELFDGSHTFQIGNKTVECWYPGEAHTKDNIVAWVPSREVLFGGCMLKAVGAGKGNLADANEDTGSASMQAVKNRYPRLKLAIPGHGDSGGMELLDFTIKLFNDQISVIHQDSEHFCNHQFYGSSRGFAKLPIRTIGQDSVAGKGLVSQ